MHITKTLALIMNISVTFVTLVPYVLNVLHFLYHNPHLANTDKLVLLS